MYPLYSALCVLCGWVGCGRVVGTLPPVCLGGGKGGGAPTKDDKNDDESDGGLARTPHNGVMLVGWCELPPISERPKGICLKF